MSHGPNSLPPHAITFASQPQTVIPAAAEQQRRPRLSNRIDEVNISPHELQRILRDDFNVRLIGVKGSLYQIRGCELRNIATESQLFASLSEVADIHWNGRAGQSKKEFYEFLKFESQQYNWIEFHPHEPRVAGVYYAVPDLPAAASGLVGRFLDFFTPGSEGDRILLHALLLTLFWGGPPGSRPAFMLTSDGHDPTRERESMGRGTGKSTLVAMFSDLVGGFLEAGAETDIEQLSTRLLSTDGSRFRVVRYDNVKTTSLSSAGLERSITSPVISGKKLYVGNGERPNLITFILTMNGVAGSADMASRCVVIKLARPRYAGTWERSVRDFITHHRGQLVAEILGSLRGPIQTLNTFSRFATWESEVLGRIPGGPTVAGEISNRQTEMNTDDMMRRLANAAIVGHVRPGQVISATKLAEILSQATGESLPPRRLKSFLNSHGIDCVVPGRRSAGVHYTANLQSAEYQPGNVGVMPPARDSSG